MRPLPDAEAVVAAYLRDHPDVAANHVGKRLEDDPDWPVIRVTRVGGIPAIQTPLILDAPRIQVEAFAGLVGETGAHETARDLAATAEAALHQIPGAALIDGVQATKAETTIGVVSSDDPEANRARYFFEIQIWLRAAPAA